MSIRRSVLPLAGVATLALCGCSPAAEAQGSDDLASRVQAQEDERAIRRVLVHYGEFLDARDYRAYAALFVRDGVWTSGFGSLTGPPPSRPC